MEQMTMSDFLPKELPLGWLKDEDVALYKGDIIPFERLPDYIGERIIEELPRQSAIDYRIVLVKDYLKDSDKVYRWKDGDSELIGICDRVRLSDDNRKGKANMWVSEMYCRDGRYCTGLYPTRFYKVKSQ